ncbi:GtrA family protein [Halorarum halophilum]|uniref:GtrA family protein n=1 Tax=Halorarum halophilum TaxID=2743090 RepID=A0A7D5GCX7_9EURY|nr:GtrA family protein [Halobaculum halophilum]QLG28572.1 GtrA family protein [Halobaculum halophilum]
MTDGGDGGGVVEGGTSADSADGAESAVTELASGTRIGQFVSVGVAGATVETVIVALLTAGFAAPPLAAKALGAETSISLMFLLNDRYTFADEGDAGLAALGRRWGRSHLVRLGGLTVAFVVLWLLTARTDVQLVIAGADFWPTVANVIGIGVGMVLNYVAESLFTWRVLD